MDIQELVHDTADAMRVPPADVLLHGVNGRARRRRVLRTAGAGVAALAVVAALGGGYLYERRAAPEPLPAAGAAPVTLPAHRAVGTATRIDGVCGASGCTPVLTTRDDRRYILPGTWSSTLTRYALSPDGRWVLYSSGGRVDVRDLTGTAAWRVATGGAGIAAAAWSMNGRWLLATYGVRRDGANDAVSTRVDLASGRLMTIPRRPVLVTEDNWSAALRTPLPNGALLGPANTSPRLVVHAPRDGGPVRVKGDPHYVYVTVDATDGRLIHSIVVDAARLFPHGSPGPNDSPLWEAPNAMIARSDGVYGIVTPPKTYLGTAVTSHPPAIVDLATGATVRSVDPDALAAHTELAGLHGSYQVFRYTDRAIEFRLKVGGRMVGLLELNADGTRVLSAHRAASGYTATTVLPGP